MQLWNFQVILKSGLGSSFRRLGGRDGSFINQILTYLKLSGCKLGLLINFNVALIKQGIKRVVNKL